MWRDLNFNQRVEVANLFKKHGIKNFNQVKELYDSFHHEYADGGDTNNEDRVNLTRIGYDDSGYPIFLNSKGDIVDSEGNTGTVRLPELKVTALDPRNHRSSFNGYQEYLPDLVSLAPVAGDIQDAYNAVNSAANGNYTDAAILGAGLVLPNAFEKPIKLLRNKFGRETVEGITRKAVKERPKLIPDTDGKPYYTFDDIPDNIKINRAPEGKYHHQDELKVDGDYDFTEGHINDGAGHISPREYARQFSEAFANAKHGQAVAFLKDDDLSFDSYADLASFLAKQQKKGKVKIVKADGAPVQMKLNGLGKNKFPNKETRTSDMNAFLDRVNEKYGTSFSHVTDKSEFVPYPPAIQKLQGREGWTRSSFWLDPIVAVKLSYGGHIE